MKGETEEEIAGCFEAIYSMDTNKVNIGDLSVVENCGTGMDSLKTFNISTLSAIVAASLGVSMARHGARAITSRCGTVDLCEALGVDVECDVSMVRHSIETCGLGLFNGMSPQVHPGGLGRILSQIRFGSTLNIAASLANPALPRIAVRGVGAPEQIEPTLAVMKRIGYRKAVIFHGFDQNGLKGMDELSTLGISCLGILRENREPEFLEIKPEEVGLSRGNYEEIRPRESVEEEAVNAVSTLSGRSNRSRTDIVALNAAAILSIAASRAASVLSLAGSSLSSISPTAPAAPIRANVK
jgi:anthranilate phosphoribosyltransferase